MPLAKARKVGRGMRHSEQEWVLHNISAPVDPCSPVYDRDWMPDESISDDWSFDGDVYLSEANRDLGMLFRFNWSSSGPDSLRERFNGLVRQWTEETMLSSSSRDICMHPAYQQVIGLGAQVLPYIMEEISQGNGHWHWALCAITRENPAAHTDSIPGAAKAWFEWGRKQGFVSS